MIEKYNRILSNLTRSRNVQFLDTSHIIGPLWDSAGDFCHYRDDKASQVEALYVLWRLLVEPAGESVADDLVSPPGVQQSPGTRNDPSSHLPDASEMQQSPSDIVL